MGTKNYWDFAMSEFAVKAYISGLVPASKIKGIPAPLIQKFCRPKETHLTSRNFNPTNFYDPYEVRAIFGFEKKRETHPNPEAIKALEAWNAEKIKPRYEVFENCVVQWVEHLGRHHFPKAITHKVKNAKVEVDGQMAIVTLENGKRFRKRLKTKGFRFCVDRVQENLQLSLFKG